jgi:hypothetical protein
MLTLKAKLIAGLIIGACAVTAVVLSYRHYDGLVQSKVDLTAKVGSLEDDVAREKARADGLKKTIDEWDQAADRQVEAQDDFSNAQRDAGTFSRGLKDAFSGEDLGAAARRDPGPAAARVNACTAAAFRLLEQSTAGVPAGGAGEAAAAACAAQAGAREDGAGPVAGGGPRR